MEHRRQRSDASSVLAQLQGPLVFDVAVPAAAVLEVLRTIPHGATVLIQKPLGGTLAEAEAIVALCRDRNLQAAVNFQLRWAPNMLAARAITDAGALGTLHDIEVQVSTHTPWELWSFLKTAPRLEIVYHSIHYIDLVRSWLGNPQRVYARTVRNPRTPDLVATRSVIVMDYDEWTRVFIATNHGLDVPYPALQHSYVQWEGTAGVMRAQMGVNLDYPKGRGDTLEFYPREPHPQFAAGPQAIQRRVVSRCLSRLDALRPTFRPGREQHHADGRRGRAGYDARGGGGVSLLRARWRAATAH